MECENKKQEEESTATSSQNASADNARSTATDNTAENTSAQNSAVNTTESSSESSSAENTSADSSASDNASTENTSTEASSATTGCTCCRNTKQKIALWAAGIIAVVALASYALFFSHTFGNNSTAYVYVDHDDTPDSVIHKIIHSAQPGITGGFTIISTMTGYTPRAGRYAIEPQDNMFGLFRRLRNGSQSPVSLTIPSVRTTHRLAGYLGQKLMLDSAAIDSAFHDNTFLAAYELDTATLPALFIPNTYEVYWTITLPQFMARMQKENRAFWTPEKQKQAAAAGLTPTQVMTLASIIDEETAAGEEKSMIAGMYINRLNARMPLQADPTVKYALGNFQLRRIMHGHLTIDSPYNTYRYEGLPPGPIRIPSIEGINAVINYVQHDYLYMCAKEDFSGRHNFARTYNEHLANARRYTQALNRRGIK